MRKAQNCGAFRWRFFSLAFLWISMNGWQHAHLLWRQVEVLLRDQIAVVMNGSVIVGAVTPGLT
jgi:hypothetical protein